MLLIKKISNGGILRKVLLIFVGLGLYSAGSGGRIDNVCSESFVKIIFGIVDFLKVKSL